MFPWLGLLLLELVLCLINPYVGLFGGVLVCIEMGIYFALDWNAKNRVLIGSMTKDAESKKMYYFAKQIINCWRILTVVFFILYFLVSVIIWFLSSGAFEGMSSKVVSPIGIDMGAELSFVLLFISISIQILVVFCVRVRTVKLYDMKYEGKGIIPNMYKKKSKGVTLW